MSNWFLPRKTRSQNMSEDDKKLLESTPNTGAPYESILDEGVIPSNEVIDAHNSQMNSDSESEKMLGSLLNCVESLENYVANGTGVTRVSPRNKPNKIFMSVVQAQGIRVTFILCTFRISSVLSLSHGFPSNADYTCDEEDDAIIKSISGYDDRVVVRIDDAFVKFCNFKCLLRPSEYLNGDVSTRYVKI